MALLVSEVPTPLACVCARWETADSYEVVVFTWLLLEAADANETTCVCVLAPAAVLPVAAMPDVAYEALVTECVCAAPPNPNTPLAV